jgi:hypothetical protein
MGWVIEDQWYRAGIERNRFEEYAAFLASVPVLYHPWRHVFIGAGPAFEASFEDGTFVLSAEVLVGVAL